MPLSSSKQRIRKQSVFSIVKYFFFFFFTFVHCSKIHSLLHMTYIQALTLLRRHKVTESSLDKRQGALDNLQSILLQIQMAETDAMVHI